MSFTILWHRLFHTPFKSEYWKSNPRKFCDFCKCWIADNKPSIEFHERGKRHKENVQIRLAEMAKKGKEDFEAQQQEGDFLKAMEEAAMKAYKNDIEQNPDMTGTQISEIAASRNAEIVVGKTSREETKAPETTRRKKWHEAKSPEGASYYWNIETGASRWEVPEEGFFSLVEQEKLKNKKKEKKEKKEKKASACKDKEKNSTTVSAPSVVYGPVQKAEAYSTWEQIEKSDEPAVDYQLPQTEEKYYGPEITFKNPEVTFSQKTVTLSSMEKSQGSVAFKKRKGLQDSKKTMRRRTDDL
ncbi:WW domain binding protein 4 [Halocaridina rubra]|uniref:WW domain binding protein 4 n=1 Tax=Halocaridina rubra TaxID=373956 RepID=A0AAN8XM62_HALRR